jgi:hypothetical protein
LVVRLTNNFRVTRGNKLPRQRSFAEALEDRVVIKPNAKLLAITFFLYFFIESSTLGLIPKQFYFVYRNIRISDLLLYAMTIYSFYNIKEYRELFASNMLIIPKLFLTYLFVQFIVSSILYAYNPLELFFRLKNIWSSFLIFPMLLLLKRKGFGYLVRLILPVAIVSNVLYILSAVTGVAFLPDVDIAQQNLPGGLKVYRVFGGTFYGELFFLGFVYIWITKKFSFYQAMLAMLFITPHILAFGRNAWFYFTFSVVVMLIWNAMRKRDFRTAFRQFAIVTVFAGLLFVVFSRFIPESDVMFEAIEARVQQGESDLKYNEGTYASRMANLTALLQLWQSGNVLFGIGMHPMWIIKPLTVEENIYAWGLSDIGWAGVLTAYGLVGFLLALIFQIYYFVKSYGICKNTRYTDILVFFALVLLIRLFFDSVISYSYKGLSTSIFGFGAIAISIAALVYKFEHPDEKYEM